MISIEASIRGQYYLAASCQSRMERSMRPRGRGLHTSSALDTASTEAREVSRVSICNDKELEWGLWIMATSGTVWSQ